MYKVWLTVASIGLVVSASCSGNTPSMNDAGADLSPTTDMTDMTTGDQDGQSPGEAIPSAPRSRWVIPIGGAQDDQSVVNDSLGVDAQGNIFISMTFKGSISVGTFTVTSEGLYDSLVAKLSPEGKVIWVSQIGGAGSNKLEGLCLDAQGAVYVVGGFSGGIQLDSEAFSAKGPDAFVAKLSPSNGALVWARQSGSAHQARAYTCVVDPKGRLIVAGAFETTISFGATTLTSQGDPSDVFLAQYSTDGATIHWATSVGGKGSDRPYGLAIGPDGALFMVGDYSQTFTAGSTTLASAGGLDMFAAKFSSVGVPIWAITGGSDDVDWFNAVAVDKSGNALVGGSSTSMVANPPPGKLGPFSLKHTGGNEAVVAKLSPSGKVIWAKSAGGFKITDKGYVGYSDVICDIALDAKGRPIYVGKFGGVMDFLGQQGTGHYDHGHDLFVARGDGAGNADWFTNYGGLDEASNYAAALSVALDHKGAAIVMGWFSGKTMISGELLTSKGGKDLFVAKLILP